MTKKALIAKLLNPEDCLRSDFGDKIGYLLFNYNE